MTKGYIKNKRTPRGGGFTLIELLVTIGVIAVLLGLLVAGGAAAMTATKRTNTKHQLRVVRDVLGQYNERYGSYPGVWASWNNGADPDAYLSRNTSLMTALCSVEAFRNKLTSLGDASFRIDSSGTKEQMTLYDAFDEPIRFDASVSIAVASSPNPPGNSAIKLTDAGVTGQFIGWSTGANLERDSRLIYTDTTTSHGTYRQKRKGILMPVGAPIYYAVPYCPDADVTGDDIYSIEDTKR